MRVIIIQARISVTCVNNPETGGSADSGTNWQTAHPGPDSGGRSGRGGGAAEKLFGNKGKAALANSSAAVDATNV